MRDGYDPTFLDETTDRTNSLVHIALPAVSMKLQDDLLLPPGRETGDVVLNYVHYSLVMSRSNRQALFSAANVDNSLAKKVSGKKGRNWFVDPRIRHEDQIDNYPYANSPWDRGHLTRRTAVTWGEDYATALKASNDSCAFTNATLQHANFNEDEWRVPEDMVATNSLAKDGKMIVITGPVFTTCDRFFTKDLGDAPVRIPSGFWKTVSYININSGNLVTDAYLFFQDLGAIRSSTKRKSLRLGNYAVTTTELSLWTGLEFDPKLFASNPMMFSLRNPAGQPDDELDRNGAEAISIKKLKDALGDDAASLEAGIADYDSIKTARDTMPLTQFYDLVEEVSWV